MNLYVFVHRNRPQTAVGVARSKAQLARLLNLDIRDARRLLVKWGEWPVRTPRDIEAWRTGVVCEQ